ncbi:hypothetical protein IFM89_013058 [Coptis chinensis]|uniref:Golgi SNAP receptor complex member 1 n=1 Tax=Coptis chinensis TaxID=261450 RepID=A0A835HPP5_9MAGN|nr:hypothetical protein IFM89_013058 [Coptis chinensis]
MDPNFELQEAGWEELRKDARKIEGDLDVKLSSYAKLSGRFTQGGYADPGSPTVGSSRSWKSMEMEIESLLEKLQDTNDSMSRCAASATPTTSISHKLARHRDILHEFIQGVGDADYGSQKEGSVVAHLPLVPMDPKVPNAKSFHVIPAGNSVETWLEKNMSLFNMKPS